jgi:putative nucleotidyltransferase with HDIG domain
MIPSIENCFFLMDKYGMLENIRIHSLVVAGIAHLISKGLKEAGIQVSVEKAVTGALMHDIGKTLSLDIGGDHSDIGRRICLENGLEEIADIVGEHVRLKGYQLNGDYSEKEIVYYADKRVNHDRIVSLQERLTYILERYGQNKENLHHLIKKNFKLCGRIEKKLFRWLAFSPEALAETPLPDLELLWQRD